VTWSPCDRSARRPRAQRRTSSNCREDLFRFSSPILTSSSAARLQTPIEFGHKVFLAESARGLITRYEVLDEIRRRTARGCFAGTPQADLRRRPKFTDRIAASFSEKNVTSCKQQGVKVVCIPQRGGSKAPEREAYEKSREFKDGQRFAQA